MKSKKEYQKRRQRRRQSEIDIYQNRAALAPDGEPFQDVTDYPCCMEELVFAMRDNNHQFSIGLSTVLHLLAIAEKEGYVPELPFKWWNRLRKP